MEKDIYKVVLLTYKKFFFNNPYDAFIEKTSASQTWSSNCVKLSIVDDLSSYLL